MPKAQWLAGALTSQDWTLVREFAGTQYPTTIAIADYKGRMLFSTAAPNHAPSELKNLPWVKEALETKDRQITLVHTNDPAVVAEIRELVHVLHRQPERPVVQGRVGFKLFQRLQHRRALEP